LKLWELGEQVMTMEWHGQGKKPKIGPFDAFFLLLYYYKQGHCAEALSREFQTTWGSIHLSPASVHHCCDNKIYFCTHFGCLQVTRALDKAEAILHPITRKWGSFLTALCRNAIVHLPARVHTPLFISKIRSRHVDQQWPSREPARL